jgi:hypothetical protein
MSGSLALRRGEDHPRRLQVEKYSYPTEKRHSASVLVQIRDAKVVNQPILPKSVVVVKILWGAVPEKRTHHGS